MRTQDPASVPCLGRCKESDRDKLGQSGGAILSKKRDQELKQLRSDLGIFRDEFPRLSDDDLFVVWFLFAFITGDKTAAVAALTGHSGEKNIDAIHIDHTARLVSIVQGKYRQKLLANGESRADVLDFAALAERLAGDDERFVSFMEGLEGAAAHLAEQAREAVLERGYRLNLHFATLGRCSALLEDEAKRQVRKVDVPASQRPRLTILTGERVMAVFRDYLDGVAPPVASVELPVEGKPQERFDEASSVSSSTFSVNGWEIGQLVNQYGVKLFARNIRGYLGETGINQEIRKTLRKDPASFWYLNNGITIVCDDAMLESSSGHERMVISNPQIINGQQSRTVFRRFLALQSQESGRIGPIHQAQIKRDSAWLRTISAGFGSHCQYFPRLLWGIRGTSRARASSAGRPS